jgi:hypothetical protein
MATVIKPIDKTIWTVASKLWLSSNSITWTFLILHILWHKQLCQFHLVLQFDCHQWKDWNFSHFQYFHIEGHFISYFLWNLLALDSRIRCASSHINKSRVSFVLLIIIKILNTSCDFFYQTSPKCFSKGFGTCSIMWYFSLF